MTYDNRRAERALSAILSLSESMLAGKITLTNRLVFDKDQRRYNWRSVVGLIWSHAHEGLGHNIPDTPPHPPVPPTPCEVFRPCPNCPLVNRINDDDTEKRGSE